MNQTQTFQQMYDTLNDEQKCVLQDMINGKSIFLTGNAGVGKTYLMEVFQAYCNENGINAVNVAPTGVAAILIGGATMHHQFRLPVGLKGLGEVPDKLPAKLSWLLDCDVLKIDEASMSCIKDFDKAMQYVELANQKRDKPIQLVLCGDFFQLPPVISETEAPHLKEFYGDRILDARGKPEGYAFQSEHWSKLGIEVRCLTQIMRQQDADFCRALDKLKYGDSTCLSYFRTHTAPQADPDAIWLCGKRDTASQRNQEMLDKVDGDEFVVKAVYNGEVKPTDNPAEDEFHFKIGAKVVMIKNDTVGGAYQNGSVGIVKAYHPAWRTIDVFFPHNQQTVPIFMEKFSKVEYVKAKAKKMVEGDDGKLKEVEYDTLKQKTIGTVEQYPMRLGYAVTIHKAQGQTFDKMNLIPEIFANGMLYVAMSRCKSVEGIHIEGSLLPRMVMSSKSVQKFYRDNLPSREDELVPVKVPRKYLQKFEEWMEALLEQEQLEGGISDVYSILAASRGQQAQAQAQTQKPKPAGFKFGSGKRTADIEKG